MRDSKSLFLLVFALVLVTISFILISIWGYHFYFQDKDSKSTVLATGNPPAVRGISTRDSLQSLLDSTLQQLTIPGDSSFNDGDDSLDKALEIKLLEYNKLKGEITEILKNKTNAQDMGVAREKIGELQQSVDQLRNQNDQVAKENARLNRILQKLVSANVRKENTPGVAGNTKNTEPAQAGSQPLLVSHLRFTALKGDPDNEKETAVASQTGKLEGSFRISIQSDKNNSPDIYVVILQPNGRVLMNSAWESGTFQSAGGSMVYSARLRFENTDNNKRLQFSISTGRLQQGVYTMQVFHNGVMIGRLTKRLS
jgi:hypothetical protein